MQHHLGATCAIPSGRYRRYDLGIDCGILGFNFSASRQRDRTVIHSRYRTNRFFYMRNTSLTGHAVDCKCQFHNVLTLAILRSPAKA